jgi:hypothetical protein
MMPASPSARYATLLRALAIVVLIVMATGMLYAVWISLINFNRIGV